MTKSNAKKSVSLRTTLAVMGALAFLIGSGFLLVHQANFLVGRSLLIAFGNGADSSYKGAWYTLGGDLVAKEFRVKPYGPNEEGTLTFKQVQVTTPGWMWILGTIGSEKIIDDIDHVHLTLTDGASDTWIDPSLGDLGPFGTETASPFEAEGCRKDASWMRSELVEMGLSPGPTTLDFDYQVERTKLTTRIELRTPGVSKVTLERHETVPSGTNPFLLDLTPTQTTDERWRVVDEGFVKARNAFCAKRDGATEGEFVTRHVDSVKRLLAISGLALNQEGWDAYSSFAQSGGEISFGGPYVTPLRSDTYYEARETGVAFLGMDGVFERDGRKILAEWSQSAPRPLAGLDSMSTYDALVVERGGLPPAELAKAAAAAAATTAAPRTATPAAVSAQKTAAEVAVAGPTAATTSAVPTSLAGASRPVAQAPTPTQAPTAAVAAVLAKRGDPLLWQDLSKYIGRDISVATAHIPARTVTLLAANATEIRVEGVVRGGHVENRINKDGFLHAVLIR